MTESTGRPDAVEHTLRSIWSEVLNLQRVEGDPSFLDLGGDSIAAALCANRMRTRLRVDIDAGVLLTGLSLSQLALHVLRTAEESSSAGS